MCLVKSRASSVVGPELFVAVVTGSWLRRIGKKKSEIFTQNTGKIGWRNLDDFGGIIF